MKTTILLPLVAVLFLACSYRPHALPVPEPSTTDGDTIISAYVIDHGWHTGIIVDAHTLRDRMPYLSQHFGKASYLEVGWGDEEFYRARETTLWMKAKAVLWPTSAVLHVVGLRKKPTLFYPDSSIVELRLTGEEQHNLLRFIESSFHLNTENAPTDLGRGLYGRSRFFKATGDYYACNTCNTWTAKGLSSAGYDIWPLFHPTAGGLLDYLREE